MDIVTAVVGNFSKVSTLATESFDQMEKFAARRVAEILNLSGRNKFRTILFSSPVEDLIEILSHPDQHRVFVSNEKGDIVGLITQSRLVKWIQTHSHLFSPEKFQLHAEQIGFSPVETINQNEFVITAFTKLWEQRVSSLAVVNDSFQITAVFFFFFRSM